MIVGPKDYVVLRVNILMLVAVRVPFQPSRIPYIDTSLAVRLDLALLALPSDRIAPTSKAKTGCLSTNEAHVAPNHADLCGLDNI